MDNKIAVGFANIAMIWVVLIGPAEPQAPDDDEFAKCSIQGPVQFCLGKTSVDTNNRLNMATVRFKVTSLYGQPIGDGQYRGILVSVPVKCEFYRADGSVAGWGRGGVSYLEHGETVIGSASAPKTPDAANAQCAVEQRYISYRAY